LNKDGEHDYMVKDELGSPTGSPTSDYRNFSAKIKMHNRYSPSRRDPVKVAEE